MLMNQINDKYKDSIIDGKPKNNTTNQKPVMNIGGKATPKQVDQQPEAAFRNLRSLKDLQTLNVDETNFYRPDTPRNVLVGSDRNTQGSKSRRLSAFDPS